MDSKQATSRIGTATQGGAPARADQSRRKARGRGAKRKLKAAAALEEWEAFCEKVVVQIKQRVAGTNGRADHRAAGSSLKNLL